MIAVTWKSEASLPFNVLLELHFTSINVNPIWHLVSRAWPPSFQFAKQILAEKYSSRISHAFAILISDVFHCRMLSPAVKGNLERFTRTFLIVFLRFCILQFSSSLTMFQVLYCIFRPLIRCTKGHLITIANYKLDLSLLFHTCIKIFVKKEWSYQFFYFILCCGVLQYWIWLWSGSPS